MKIYLIPEGTCSSSGEELKEAQILPCILKLTDEIKHKFNHTIKIWNAPSKESRLTVELLTKKLKEENVRFLQKESFYLHSDNGILKNNNFFEKIDEKESPLSLCMRMDLYLIRQFFNDPIHESRVIMRNGVKTQVNEEDIKSLPYIIHVIIANSATVVALITTFLKQQHDFFYQLGIPKVGEIHLINNGAYESKLC